MVENDGRWAILWRGLRRSGILRSETNQIVMGQIVDRDARGEANPCSPQAWRKVVYEVGQGAQSLPKRGCGLGRQPAQDPVGLAAHVLINAHETEKFELRRSPSADVSETVAAVDDDRLLRDQAPVRVARKAAYRQMDGALDVSGFVLVRGQGIDDLRAVGAKPQDRAMVDYFHV